MHAMRACGMYRRDDGHLNDNTSQGERHSAQFAPRTEAQRRTTKGRTTSMIMGLWRARTDVASLYDKKRV